MRRSRVNDALITVCDSCLRTCCFQGKFYCENYRTAGTRELPVQKLRELALEHPDYWKWHDVPEVNG